MYEEKPVILPKDHSLFEDAQSAIGWREFNKLDSLEWQDELIAVDSLDSWEEDIPYNNKNR